MDINSLITDSRVAFLNGQFANSLEIALQAVKADQTSADAYTCAANACMSLEKYEQAVEYYKSAVRNEPNNGDRYFFLGYAYASVNKTVDAIKALTKAEELKCSKENLATLYQLMGLVCFDAGKIDDALINLKKAEYCAGPNIELLSRMVIIYGIKKDTKKGLFTTNQMKLLAPSDYTGYKYAFNFLIQAKKFDKAEEELRKAEKFANLNMDYYTDRMTLELKKSDQSDKERYSRGLKWLSDGLRACKPSFNDVRDAYVNSAELYLQLEEPDRTIDCLNAAQGVVSAFNNGFSIIPETFETKTLTEYDVEEMMEADHISNEEKYGIDGITEMAESIEADELGNRDYLTDIDDDEEDAPETTPYKLNDSDASELKPELRDQINRLFVGAYTLKNDYDMIIRYAKALQASTSSHNSYMGRYAEVNAMLKAGYPQAEEEYDKLITFLKHEMIKNPADMSAVSYRIQCCVDIKRFDEAEQLSSLLSPAFKNSVTDAINKAKSGGGN